MNGQQVLPFFNGPIKYVNPPIDDQGIFLLPKDWLEANQLGKQIVVFNRNTSTTMDLVPFDVIDESENFVAFKFVENYALEVNDWTRTLLTRFDWTWYEQLAETLESEWFKKLNKQLNVYEREKGAIWPVKEKVYRSFDSDFTNIKVCILGQSPYPNTNASGIAFATELDKKPVSLQYFERAVGSPISNNLQDWIDQGVLLLNSSLTVTSNANKDFFDNWQPFMKQVINALNGHDYLVWILMGAKAKTFEKSINPGHTIIKVEHPAAAAYEKREWKHEGAFQNASAYLAMHKFSPIVWSTATGNRATSEFEETELF